MKLTINFVSRVYCLVLIFRERSFYTNIITIHKILSMMTHVRRKNRSVLRLCPWHCTAQLSVPTQKLATFTAHTSNMVPSGGGWPRGYGELNATAEYLFPSQWIVFIHFRFGPSGTRSYNSHCTNSTKSVDRTFGQLQKPHSNHISYVWFSCRRKSCMYQVQCENS